jgi:hypothetical protein
MARPCRPLSHAALRLITPVVILVPAAACGGDVTLEARPATTRPPSAPPNNSWMAVAVADRTKFLAAMDAIDRRLTGDDQRALSAAATICFQVYEDKPIAALRVVVQAEYASGGVRVSPGQAGKILVAVKKWICSSHPLYLRWQT